MEEEEREKKRKGNGTNEVGFEQIRTCSVVDHEGVISSGQEYLSDSNKSTDTRT